MKISTAHAFDYMDDGNWTVLAETKHGECFTLCHLWRVAGDANAKQRADRFADKVAARGEIDLDHWVFFRTIYGSAAFQEEESEAAMYADVLRSGAGRLEDVPDNIRTLL